VPPTDSNIGRISIVADPQKATFALIQKPPFGGRKPGELDEPGRVGWHELLAADRKETFDFYGELFGWQKAHAETDPADLYQLFSAGGQTIGGMLTKLPSVSQPCWLYYFNVLMVAGSSDVPIPKAPCLRCKVLRVRRAPSDHLPRKTVGLLGGVVLLHRAGLCSKSRSAEPERPLVPTFISSPRQLIVSPLF
jgi:predicted enzyme related to lactoylglutathione lyase